MLFGVLHAAMAASCMVEFVPGSIHTASSFEKILLAVMSFPFGWVGIPPGLSIPLNAMIFAFIMNLSMEKILHK